ncbi:unnamed protein product [Sphagnum compactum]
MKFQSQYQSMFMEVMGDGNEAEQVLLVSSPRQWDSWKQLQREEVALFSTFAVLFVTLVFFYVVIRVAFRRKVSNTILLVGLSDAGKTTLFYQLRDGSAHQGSVTSMEPNDDEFILHSESTKKAKIKPVHIVDVPGHARLRPKLDDFLPNTCGLVFVVDALDFMPHLRSAAEYLYEVLTKTVVARKKMPVLLACNKMDKITAHSTDFIRKQLEKEINKLRLTRSAISSADVTSEISLGVEGEPFKFSQCVNQVSTAEMSALNGQVEEVERFIREQVKP